MLTFLRCKRLFSSKSFYDILGISKNASASEIKSAYFEESLCFHFCSWLKNITRMQTAVATLPLNSWKSKMHTRHKVSAYFAQVLSDSQKRLQYDQFGSTQENNGKTDSYFVEKTSHYGNSNYETSDFNASDIFGSIFNRFEEQMFGHAAHRISRNIQVCVFFCCESSNYTLTFSTL